MGSEIFPMCFWIFPMGCEIFPLCFLIFPMGCGIFPLEKSSFPAENRSSCRSSASGGRSSPPRARRSTSARNRPSRKEGAPATALRRRSEPPLPGGRRDPPGRWGRRKPRFESAGISGVSGDGKKVVEKVVNKVEEAIRRLKLERRRTNRGRPKRHAARISCRGWE